VFKELIAIKKINAVKTLMHVRKLCEAVKIKLLLFYNQIIFQLIIMSWLQHYSNNWNILITCINSITKINRSTALLISQWIALNFNNWFSINRSGIRCRGWIRL